MVETDSRERGSVTQGIVLLGGMHVAALAVGWTLARLGLLPFGTLLLLAGLVQFAYVVPAITALRRKGRTETVRGLVLGACLTMLANGVGCALLIASGPDD